MLVKGKSILVRGGGSKTLWSIISCIKITDRAENVFLKSNEFKVLNFMNRWSKGSSRLFKILKVRRILLNDLLFILLKIYKIS